MKIFVKRVTGKTIVIDVEKDEKISAIKRKIHEKEGLNPDKQKLIFLGIELEDDKTFNYYDTSSCATFHFILRMST